MTHRTCSSPHFIIFQRLDIQPGLGEWIPLIYNKNLSK